jgi:hypothetical protein
MLLLFPRAACYQLAIHGSPKFAGTTRPIEIYPKSLSGVKPYNRVANATTPLGNKATGTEESARNLYSTNWKKTECVNIDSASFNRFSRYAYGRILLRCKRPDKIPVLLGFLLETAQARVNPIE